MNIQLKRVPEYDHIVDIRLDNHTIGCFRVMSVETDRSIHLREYVPPSPIPNFPETWQWHICLYRPVTAAEFAPIVAVWNEWIVADKTRQDAIIQDLEN